MALSREDKARLAFDLAGDTRRLVWTLAVNPAPLRRGVLASISGVDPSITVRVLAKLANADLLAPTDGMTFQLADDGLASTIVAEIPEEDETELRRRSLEVLSEVPGGAAPPLVLAEHCVHLGDPARAVHHLATQGNPSATGEARRVARVLDIALERLLSLDGTDASTVVAAGLMRLESTVDRLKKRARAALIKRLATLPMSEADRVRFDRQKDAPPVGNQSPPPGGNGIESTAAEAAVDPPQV